VANIIRRPLTASEANEHLFQSRLTYGIIFHRELITDLFHSGEESRKTDRRGPRDVVLHKTVVDVLEQRAREYIFNVTTQWSDVDVTTRRTTRSDFGYQRVAVSKLALEMLRTAEALELTVDHDCNASAQRVTLLHAVDITTTTWV